jgi:hypothetical protein
MKPQNRKNPINFSSNYFAEMTKRWQNQFQQSLCQFSLTDSIKINQSTLYQAVEKKRKKNL